MALTSGIILGRYSSPNEREAADKSSAGGLGRASSGNATDSSGSGGQQSPTTGTPRSTDSAPERNLGTILALPNQPERIRRLLALFDRMSKEELSATYDQLRLDPAAQMHTEEMGLALQAWVDRDPIAALDYLLAKEDAIDWERETAIGAWASKDPQAAMDWADRTPDPGTMNNWRIGAAVGAALSNPQLSREYIERIAAETHPQSAKTARQATNALNPDSYTRPPSFSESRGE